MDLSPLLQKIANQVEVLAHSKGLTFSSQLLCASPLLVSGDSASLETLLLAILDNALKYTRPGGYVQLRSFTISNEAVIEVEDTGVGIAPQDIPRIFDRFYRADQSRSREVAGSGLGLSIARWIAETHKGRIEVESEVGIGSRFHIVLPLVSAETFAAVEIPELLDSEAAPL